MATVPERLFSLELSVASLLPQVDRIHVALNGHWAVPRFLEHPKVRTTICDNSIGDGAKFMGLPGRGWLLTCDDDLIYPPDYVETMVAGAERHGCIVTLHGRTFKRRPIRSYYRSPARKYHCLKSVEQPVEVEVAGTGVVCWNASRFRFRVWDIGSPNMSDLYFSHKARKEGVPIVVLPHAAGWCGHIQHERTIYRGHRYDDAEQTAFYNEQWAAG